jgi:thiosulfate/3-mercaptopyruvate sulfurtransferase
MRNVGIVLLLMAVAVDAPAQKPAHPEMLVSTDWLATHLQDPNLVVLHLAKEKQQYDAGHVPGARWISLDQLLVNRDGVVSELPPLEDLVKLFESLGVSNESRVVVYSTNWPPLSTRIYFTLDYLGLGEGSGCARRRTGDVEGRKTSRLYRRRHGRKARQNYAARAPGNRRFA